jgi:hypothetical protein
MATLTALFTSDASLVRCELDRVRPTLVLAGDYAGIGAWSDGMPLQRRFGAGRKREDVWECPDSDVALLVSNSLPVGANVEDSAQPFRFHQWLFGAVSVVAEAERVRDRLYEELPEFLQHLVRSHQLDEVIFAHFLASLRVLGRIDDPTLEATVAAKALQVVARAVEQASGSAGGTQKSQLALAASNGRVLVAARRGEAPLRYSLLEGEVACRRCGLKGDEKDKVTLVRDHRRRRSVVLSTVDLGGHHVAVPDGGAVAVDRALAVTVLPAT